MGEVVRLFAVEGRTALERENTRRAARRAQGALFEAVGELVAEVGCAVCGVEAGHTTAACTVGEAPTLLGGAL